MDDSIPGIIAAREAAEKKSKRIVKKHIKALAARGDDWQSNEKNRVILAANVIREGTALDFLVLDDWDSVRNRVSISREDAVSLHSWLTGFLEENKG